MTGASPISFLGPTNDVAEFELTPRALRDLDAIADYSISKWGADRTEQYLGALVDRMQWLADNPELGRKRNDIAAGYRCFGEGRHLIFYLAAEGFISIIGVPHASMDIDAHIIKPSER